MHLHLTQEGHNRWRVTNKAILLIFQAKLFLFFFFLFFFFSFFLFFFPYFLISLFSFFLIFFFSFFFPYFLIFFFSFFLLGYIFYSSYFDLWHFKEDLDNYFSDSVCLYSVVFTWKEKQSLCKKVHRETELSKARERLLAWELKLKEIQVNLPLW